MLTFGSLFAGIGGFDLGFEGAGMRQAFAVELNAQCNAVRRRHWPQEETHTDVTAFTLRSTDQRPDLLCGGFPCQDLSVAGRRAGLAGGRSGLWWEFRRIIAELYPQWVCIENVPGLLSSHGGRDMGAVIRSLSDLGYGVAWRVLDSQWFGVAQRRKRVFIVGCFGDVRRAGEVLFEREGLPWNPPPRRETRSEVARYIARGTRSSGYRLDANGEDFEVHTLRGEGHDASEDGTGRGTPIVFDERNITSRHNRSRCEAGLPCHTLHSDAPRIAYTIQERACDPSAVNGLQGMGVREEVAYTLEARHGVQAVAFAQNQVGEVRTSEIAGTINTNSNAIGRNTQMVAGPMRPRRMTPRECERVQGFPDDWTQWMYWAKNKTNKKRVSDSARYRMLGNAVTVTVAEWIGRRIVEKENAK